MAPSRNRVPQICLVSREVFPLTGGGIGSYVTALAGLLREMAQVRIVTSDALEPAWQRLKSNGDPRLPDGVQWTFVPEPPLDELDDWFGFHHCWSARVLEALEADYGSHGPDLIEFPDYHGEGFVPAQAKRAGHRTLRDTHIALRAHTSFEMCRTLDGWVGTGDHERSVLALERTAFRLADSLLWAGGDVLGTYERFYGPGNLPRGVRVRHPLVFDPPDEIDDSGYEASYPVKFLYVGRLERRKGVKELVNGLQRNDSDAWTLTLVGGDTETGPVGVSQRAQLELMALGDERISLVGNVPRHELVELIRDHHALVMPSRWECWPTVVLEGMTANRPVIGTPTGGMLEMIRDGHSGWLTRGVGAEALSQCVDALVADLERIQKPIRAGTPRIVGGELIDESTILEAYGRLIDRPARPAARPRGRRAAPLVSVIVPYFQLSEYLLDALRSVDAQTYPLLEIVVVNDGSRSAADRRALERAEVAGRVPLRVLSQPNAGLGGARMAGIWQSRGRYVLPLDADNMLTPTFVERCVELLEADSSIAYVTSWSEYIDEKGRPLTWSGSGEPRGYHPLGNMSPLVEELNTAGDALAVLPRRVFDLGFRYSSEVPICEDWMLARALHRAGRYGVVIPEPLVRYRVRSGSMYQATEASTLARIREEATAQLNEEAMAWAR